VPPTNSRTAKRNDDNEDAKNELVHVDEIERRSARGLTSALQIRLLQENATTKKKEGIRVSAKNAKQVKLPKRGRRRKEGRA
jgi:hypothetical protein